MLDSGEEGISKLDGVIADVRLINLYVTSCIGNYYIKQKTKDKDKESEKDGGAKKIQDLRKMNTAHILQYSNRVSDYLKKTFQDMQRSKITIAPIIFRTLRNRYQEQDFLRFENQVYGLKFIITNLDKEAVMHLEIYRRVRGGRVSSEALRKLEITFTTELSQKYSDGVVSQQLLEIQGRAILEEVTEIMSGEVCERCNWHLVYHPEYKIYLPPTLREVQDLKDSKNQKRRKLYYHQNCL